jgi:hypothetical protein
MTFQFLAIVFVSFLILAAVGFYDSVRESASSVAAPSE